MFLRWFWHPVHIEEKMENEKDAKIVWDTGAKNVDKPTLIATTKKMAVIQDEKRRFAQGWKRYGIDEGRISKVRLENKTGQPEGNNFFGKEMFPGPFQLNSSCLVTLNLFICHLHPWEDRKSFPSSI
jgi:hypothetical protein